MNITLFAQFFPPEIGAAPMRNMGHVSHLANAKNHKVTVVTNVPNSPFGKIYKGYRNKFQQEEFLEGVRVRRMWTLTSGKHQGKWRRGVSFLTSLFMSLIGGMRGERPDIVIASAPYFTGIPGLITAFLRRATFVYEMHDPWIQVIAANNVISKKGFIFKLLFHVEKFIASRAKLVIVIGKEMAQLVKETYKLKELPKVVPNAANVQLINHKLSDPLLEGAAVPPDTGNKFVAGVIGNMGSWYDFDVILKAAELLARENCYFMFLGEGKQRQRIAEKIKHKSLKNVHLFNAVPANQVGVWLQRCNVTIVSLKPQSIFRVYMPIRILDSLLFEIPVFFGGDGEVQRLLEQSAAGKIFKTGDPDSLVNLIKNAMKQPDELKTMGRRGSEFIYDHLTHDNTAKQLNQFLENLNTESTS